MTKLRPFSTFDTANPRQKYASDLERRVWSQVDTVSSPHGCWLWVGYVPVGKTGGYGRISVRGKKERAHRVVWRLLYGEIPEDRYVLHTCERFYAPGDDTYRRCVRHLYLGTMQDNANDLRTSGRSNFLHQAKITYEIAERIRAEVAGGTSRRELAERYDLSGGSLSVIISGKAWKPQPVSESHFPGLS